MTFLGTVHRKRSAAVGPTVLFRDTFTGPDGRRLDDPAHVPDIDTVGNGWVQNRTELQINNNQAWSDTGFQLVIGTTDINNADVIIKTKISINENQARYRGIAARTTSASEYLFMCFYQNLLQLRSNSTTYVSKSFSWVADQFYDFRLELSGSNVKGYVDDNLEFDETVTQYQGVTNHGIVSARRDARLDDFEITTLT